MVFMPFGSRLLVSYQPEDAPTPSRLGGLWSDHVSGDEGLAPLPAQTVPDGTSSMPLSQLQAQSGRPNSFGNMHTEPSWPERPPSNPLSLEYPPMGRPPLTREQTHRASGMQPGIDPWRMDPLAMRFLLEEPDAGQEGQALSREAPKELHGGLWTTRSVQAMNPPSLGAPDGGGLADPGGLPWGAWRMDGAGGMAGAPAGGLPGRGASGRLEEMLGMSGGLGSGFPAGPSVGTPWGEPDPAAEGGSQPPGGKQEDGGGQDGGKPKEAPSPGGTVLITTYTKYGGVRVGDHSALYLPAHRFLCDPAGSFRQNERGSAGIFELGPAGLQACIKYHEESGSTVCQTKIPTTPSE